MRPCHSTAACLLALAFAVSARSATRIDVLDVNGNTLPGGYLSERDTAYSVLVRTDIPGFDTLTVSASTLAAGDSETLILADTATFRGQWTFRGPAGFALASAAADGRTQASAFDTLRIRWVNPADSADIVVRNVPVRPAARAGRAWFSTRADGRDTVTVFTSSEAALHFAVEDQLLPAGAAPQAVLITRPAVSGAAADTETVDLGPIAGRAGYLSATVPVQASGATASGDGKLRLDGGNQIHGVYRDPVDSDTAAAYAGFGAPIQNILGNLQFTDADGGVIPKGSVFHVAAGRIHLLYQDDWADSLIPVKTARLEVLNSQGNAPGDTETVTLSLVPEWRSGATGTWLGSLALKDFGPIQSGDGVATQRGLARLVAAVEGHRANAAAEDTLTDTLQADYPQQTLRLGLADGRDPGKAVGIASASFAIKVEGGSRTTGVDSVGVLVRCAQSGDSLAFRLAEDAALAGTFACAPIPLRRGSARADDSLQCLEKDLLRVRVTDAFYTTVSEDILLDGSIAVRPAPSIAPHDLRLDGDRLSSSAWVNRPPRAVIAYDALGVFAGFAKPLPGSGAFLLPPARGPRLLEIIGPDGDRSFQSSPRPLRRR